MKFENKSTEELQALDSKFESEITMLCSWANRDLSKRNRARLVAVIREEQAAITEELMKRELVGA